MYDSLDQLSHDPKLVGDQPVKLVEESINSYTNQEAFYQQEHKSSSSNSTNNNNNNNSDNNNNNPNNSNSNVDLYA